MFQNIKKSKHKEVKDYIIYMKFQNYATSALLLTEVLIMVYTEFIGHFFIENIYERYRRKILNKIYLETKNSHQNSTSNDQLELNYFINESEIRSY